MQLLKLMHMDFLHCVVRKKNLLVLMLCLFLLYGSVYETLLARWQYGVKANEAVEMLLTLLFFDRFKGVLVSLLAAFCSYVMGDEIRTGFCNHVLNRGISIARYTLSKLLVNGFAVIGACMLSFCLFAVTLNWAFPVGGGHELIYLTYYKEIYTSGTYWVVATLAGLQFGLAALVLIQVGVFVSVIFPKKYISMTIPYIVFSFLYSLFGDNIDIPDRINFFLLSACVDILRNNRFWPNFLYSNSVLFLEVLITGACCVWIAERRHRHGFF